LHKISPASSFIGRNHLFLESVDSTNDFAKSLISENIADHGFLVYASTQNLGKGRNGNKWEGDAGKNLYASFVLKPFNLSISDLPFLNFACSLAAYDTVAHYMPHNNVWIKWPNDIIVQNKKVAGILMENTLGSSVVNSAVFGLGININQDRFSSELAHASSFVKQLGQDIRIGDVIEILCLKLEDRINQLQNMQYDLLHAQYNQVLYKKGETVDFAHEGDTFSGIINGVNRTGEIEINSTSGIHKYSQGDIKLEVYGLTR